MNTKTAILLIILILILGTGLFFLYKNPKLPPVSPSRTLQPTSAFSYKGKITQIAPVSGKLEIILNVKTPQILVSSNKPVAKVEKNGEVKEISTADKLKIGDNVEITDKVVYVYEN